MHNHCPSRVYSDTAEFQFSLRGDVKAHDARSAQIHCRVTDPHGKVSGKVAGTFDWRECKSPLKVTDLETGEYSFQLRPGDHGEASNSCEFKVWLPEIKVTSPYPTPSSS